MISCSRFIVFVLLLSLCNYEMTFAKTLAPKATKAVVAKSNKKPVPGMIYFKEFKKMDKQTQAQYLEYLREATIKLQAKDPSFAEFIWESFAKNAEAMGEQLPAENKNTPIEIENPMADPNVPATSNLPVVNAKPKGPGAWGSSGPKWQDPGRVRESEKVIQGATDLTPNIDNLSNDEFSASTVDNPPSLSCSGKDSTDCKASSFPLRCFYAGFAIGAGDSGKNSCGPVTGDLCDGGSGARETRPKISSFSKSLCKLNPNAGKCGGNNGGTITAGNSNKLIVCNPLLFGLVVGDGNGVGVSDDQSKAHVICVRKSANASKDCESKMSENSAFWVSTLTKADDGAGFDQMVSAMQNTCGKSIVWDSSSKAFVDSGNDDAMRAATVGVKNLGDLKQTCMTLMGRVVSIRDAEPNQEILQRGAETLGVH